MSKLSPNNSYRKEVLSSFKKRIIITSMSYKRLSNIFIFQLDVVGQEINSKYRVYSNRNDQKAD